MTEPDRRANLCGMELEHVYLPDSWVLAIETDATSVCFLLDAALTAGHPLFYSPPKAGEQHAYARLRWCLIGEVHWNEGPNLDHPAHDATGEADYGHVDSWIGYEDNECLEGDWGNVVVFGATHLIEFAGRST